jgi:hypothetical protein
MQLMHRINTECAATRFRRGRMLAVALAPALLLSLSDHPERWAGTAAIAAPSCRATDRGAAREIDRLLWWHFAQAGWSAPWQVLPGGKRESGDGC